MGDRLNQEIKPGRRIKMLANRSLTCIVPARNESGILNKLLADILDVHQISMVIIVEGGSTDSTLDIATNIASLNPNRVICHQQTGKGKFNAVLEGCKLADSEFIMIWDADGTVPKSEAMRIIDTAISTKSFAMGDRLRGNIEPGAMQFLNKIGNWVFALLWAPILRIKPSDVFCGTKVAPKSVFTEIPQTLIEADPYGDLALLMTSRLLEIDVIPVTVDYKSRTYGESKMRRWTVGLAFLKITISCYQFFFRKPTNA